MMRHKAGFMRPDGDISLLNHPLLVLTCLLVSSCCWLSCKLVLQLVPLSSNTIRFVTSHFIPVELLIVVLCVWRWLWMKLVMLCWPLSSAFFPEDNCRLGCVWFITWFPLNTRHWNVERNPWGTEVANLALKIVLHSLLLNQQHYSNVGLTHVAYLPRTKHDQSNFSSVISLHYFAV